MKNDDYRTIHILRGDTLPAGCATAGWAEDRREPILESMSC